MGEVETNPEIIPPDYSCGLIFRGFQVTLIHEHSRWLGRDGILHGNERSDVVSRHFWGVNACLEHYLMAGWPKAHPGARWNHRERSVSVFADDLFLCPDCGRFNLVDLGDHPLDVLGLEIEGEQIERWPSKIKLTSKSTEQFRNYCQSRLNIDEFELKKCERKVKCRQFCAGALDRARHVWGWKDNQSEQERLAKVAEEDKRIEQLLLNEGFVYLIRMGEFFKIGIANNFQTRLSAMRVNTPHNVELLKNWRCRNPRDFEKRMHLRFREFKVQGEWFRLPEDVVAFLIAMDDVSKVFPPERQNENAVIF